MQNEISRRRNSRWGDAPIVDKRGQSKVAVITERDVGRILLPLLVPVVETMRQTGNDMSEKYKETSTGGLAVNVVEC